MNEAETRAELIGPALKAAGWCVVAFQPHLFGGGPGRPRFHPDPCTAAPAALSRRPQSFSAA
jgi:hypothetical protein